MSCTDPRKEMGRERLLNIRVDMETLLPPDTVTSIPDFDNAVQSYLILLHAVMSGGETSTVYTAIFLEIANQY